jgi:hypothetical protein
VRRSVSTSSRAFGLLFAVPFYVACDGIIAPLLGLTPTITRIPWYADGRRSNENIWGPPATLVRTRLLVGQHAMDAAGHPGDKPGHDDLLREENPLTRHQDAEVTDV